MNRSNRISRLWGLMLAGGFLCSGLVLAQQDLGPAPASSSTALARAGGVLEKQASVEFSSITETCQQVAGVSFGPGGKWASCRVLASGFVATIGLQDFFFARYCLGENGAQCDSLAQVVFRNRAYRSEAHVEMVRFDPAGTQYERPLLVGSESSNALVIGVRRPGQRGVARQYFRRDGQFWDLMDGRAWLADLQSRLPRGVSIRATAQELVPDPHTMSLQVPLFRAADSDCCARAGVAQVHLNVEEGRFQVAGFTLVRGGK